MAPDHFVRQALNGNGTHLSVHGPLSPPYLAAARLGEDLGESIGAAGLTGRGGAGFPTARKLEALRRSGRRPLVVVNAMEGGATSDKDRVLLANAAHLVPDGPELATIALCASGIVVCVAQDP